MTLLEIDNKLVFAYRGILYDLNIPEDDEIVKYSGKFLVTQSNKLINVISGKDITEMVFKDRYTKLVRISSSDNYLSVLTNKSLIIFDLKNNLFKSITTIEEIDGLEIAELDIINLISHDKNVILGTKNSYYIINPENGAIVTDYRIRGNSVNIFGDYIIYVIADILVAYSISGDVDQIFYPNSNNIFDKNVAPWIHQLLTLVDINIDKMEDFKFESSWSANYIINGWLYYFNFKVSNLKTSRIRIGNGKILF